MNKLNRTTTGFAGIEGSRRMRGIVVLLPLWLALSGCHRAGDIRPQDIGPQPVRVMTLTPRQIRDVITLDGVVAPAQKVNLVARVTGTLEAVLFNDGDTVHRGQLLFTIERGPYLEQVRLNQARLDQAQSDYLRQTELMKENATAQASVDSALSTLQQSKANLRLAQINLDYTEIRAPFDGIIGRRTVDAGNYVGATAGGTVLATVMQMMPAYVNAAIGEREALRLRRKLAASSADARSGVGSTVVTATLQGEQQPGETGVLDFLDHQVGQSSGTIALRGRFRNRDLHLIPGLYARLEIELGTPRSALVVPQAVVQSDQQGDFVYVVGPDQHALRRKIITAALPAEEREVLNGLRFGERVVVAGYARISEGQALAPADSPANIAARTKTVPAAAPVATAKGAR